MNAEKRIANAGVFDVLLDAFQSQKLGHLFEDIIRFGDRVSLLCRRSGPIGADGAGNWFGTDVFFNCGSDFTHCKDFLKHVFGQTPTKHHIQALGNIQTLK